MMSDNWEKVRLGDICEIIGGGTPKTTVDEYWGGNLSWITPKDLSGYDYRYISSGERNITEDGFKSSSARKLPKGTVLFTSRAPIGYVAIANNEVTTNQGFKSLICDPQKCNNEFLYYCLKLNVKNIEAIASGSTFKEVSGKTLGSFEINLPPLETQEKIAKILSSLDDKIANNKKTAEKLEEIAQTLFNRWFVEFNFPDENGLPYKDNGGEMVESELGLIPKGWEIKLLDDLINISSGKRPQTKDIQKSQYNTIKLIGASSIMGYVHESNVNDKVLIIGRVGTLGIVQRFNEPIWASDNTLILRSKFYEFTYQILKSINFESYNTGSTQPLVTQGTIKTIPYINAPTDLVNEFEDLSKILFEKIKLNLDENVQLVSTRDTLLTKLMSGEVKL